jgi:hypothetical protein
MPDCLQQLLNAPGSSDAGATAEVEEEESPAQERYTTYVRLPGFPGTEATVAFSHDPRSFVR